MDIIKNVNAGLAFLLELAMYLSYAGWAYSLTSQPWLRWLAAIGLPLVVAVIWGLFAAPQASFRLHQPLLFALELGLLLLSAGLLYLTGRHSQAIGLAALALLSQTVALWLHQG